MFDDNIRVESVPRRVFEFCRISSLGSSQLSEIKDKLIPSGINEKSTDYMPFICNAAIELNLISIDENKTVTFIGDKDDIKDLSSFRKYCNSLVWKNKNVRFYKIANCFLSSNVDWVKQPSFSTSMSIAREIREKMAPDLDADLNRHILGERFWLSFLGFGYIDERKNGFVFLPNMYIALKDFIALCDFEKNKEMTIGNFLKEIERFCDVFEDTNKPHEICCALSNALRQMNDLKEIKLIRNSDSEDIWNLYEMKSHEFKKEITHITILKGGK